MSTETMQMLGNTAWILSAAATFWSVATVIRGVAPGNAFMAHVRQGRRICTAAIGLQLLAIGEFLAGGDMDSVMEASAVVVVLAIAMFLMTVLLMVGGGSDG